MQCHNRLWWQKSRLRAGILIVDGDKILLCEEADEPGVFSLPGGGLEEGETPIEAAIREAQEEVYINVKNAVDTKYDYCECHSELKDWVKEHIPEKEAWYNYYTCLIIAEYNGKYTGKVDAVDKDSAMKNSATWYEIKDVINDASFKEQWKNALIDFGYYDMPVFEEDLKDEAKTYFGITNKWRFGLYINTDGTILDGSGKKLGNTNPTARAVDHREISDIFEGSISGNDAMIAYMNEGNIRLKPEAPGIELIKAPTKAQLETIYSLILHFFGEEFYVDYSNSSGQIIDSVYYEKANTKILKDLEHKFGLKEDTRNSIVSKSRNVGPYLDKTRGKNRFERKKFSKVANAVKAYNKIDMNKFFKEDLLEVVIPITGETASYDVTVRLNGVVAEMARNIKNNKNKFEYRTVIQSLTKIFNTSDVFTKCTCADFKYRFAHWNIVHNISVDDSAHDPGPGKGIANPNDDKGRGCKHILLVLANGDWLMKVASVINNYVHYAEEHLQKPFLKVIFPKLYGVNADEMVEQDIIDDESFLDSSKGLIDAINEYGRNRGKIKPGTNKNPVATKKSNTKDTDTANDEDTSQK